MSRVHAAWVAAVTLVVGGCAQSGDPVDLQVDSTLPLALENSLVYFQESEQQALWVDVHDTPPTVRRKSMPEGRCEGRARPGAEDEQLVVMCAGKDATTTRDAVPATMLLLGKNGIVREYPLPGRFAQFQVSEDGAHAFVFGSQGGIVLATEVAFVDLDEAPARDNPRGTTVRSLGGETPSGVAFSHPMDVAGERRRLAVALSEGHVNLFDLGHVERGAITVPLTLEGEPTVETQQIVFGRGTVYVRAAGLNHVLALSLNPSEGAHGFSPSPFSLTTGGPIQHMLLLERDEGELLLVLSSTAVFVLDPRTGVSSKVPTGVAYTEAFRFRGAAPGDDNPRDRALLHGEDAQIAFLDLEGVETQLARNLETLPLTAPVTGAFPWIEEGRVAFLHEDQTLLSVVELADRTVVPVRTREAMQAALLDPQRGRLWLRTDGGAVATLSLVSLEANEVLLDDPARSLLLLGGKRPQLVAVHDGAQGHVTLLDPSDPSRDDARSLAGFLWDGLFDERTHQ